MSAKDAALLLAWLHEFYGMQTLSPEVREATFTIMSAVLSELNTLHEQMRQTKV